MRLLWSVASLLVFLLASVYEGSCHTKVKITSLPGYNGPALSQSSGYITVDPQNGRALFYWLIEAEVNPEEAPLVFWYQGGPGCSGLIGLFTEHGPYRPNMKGGIDYTGLSWTKFANVVYLEAPAGVGFSYSNTTSDYTTNDNRTADDNFKFISGFLEAYPQFQGRDIWLAGESYAGVYVPTLTSVIFSNPSSPVYKQLKGLSLGNPVISCVSADYGAIQFNLFYWHGLVSHTLYAQWVAANCPASSSNPGCGDILSTAINQIGVIYQQKKRQSQNEPSLDPDNLYQDFCTGNGTLAFSQDTGYPDSCSPVGARMGAYLNRQDVQRAIGVATSIFPVNWQECSNNINYSPSGDSMIPHYESFFRQNPNLQVLIYSGDVDIYTVPFGYTQACLAELAENVQSAWQPWFVNEATAGYVEVYDHYTFATIKGGGHEAPQYQPLNAYNMFSRFMTSGNLNDNSPRNNKFGPPIARNFLNRRTQSKVLKEYDIVG